MHVFVNLARITAITTSTGRISGSRRGSECQPHIFVRAPRTIRLECRTPQMAGEGEKCSGRSRRPHRAMRCSTHFYGAAPSWWCLPRFSILIIGSPCTEKRIVTENRVAGRKESSMSLSAPHARRPSKSEWPGNTLRHRGFGVWQDSSSEESTMDGGLGNCKWQTRPGTDRRSCENDGL